MTEFNGAWDRDALETFLQDVTVPIRLATRRPDGSLWLVALWYRHHEGFLECASGADAHVVRFLRADPEIAFDVSTNDIPYRGVRGTGTASLESDDEKVALRALLERYLDGTDSPLASWLLSEDREEVRIRIEPTQVFSWDYSDRMRTP